MGQRSRPRATNAEPAGPSAGGVKSDVSVSHTTNPVPSRDVVSRFKDAYAVVVIGKAARRHVFFGLPAAQHAVDRAHARGDYADLVLVRLMPVGEVTR